MNDSRPAVKRARVDPGVIAEWNVVCARDAVPRRRLRTVFQLATLLAVGLGILAVVLKPQAAAALVVGAGLGFAIDTAIVVLIWNNVLVGKPPCPACGEPITLSGTGRGLTASHPESQAWCPHCFVWLKSPADSHWPLT